MDALEIRHALGAAYARAQVASDRSGAVAGLREQISAAPEARIAAQQHLQGLAQVVAARSRGGRCGCHVTQMTHDLLAEALTDV